MENILYWIVVGVAAGWLARLVVKGSGQGGILVDFVVGAIGAVAGGFLVNSLGGPTYGGLLNSIVVAFVGAVLFLIVLRVATNGRGLKALK